MSISIYDVHGAALVVGSAVVAVRAAVMADQPRFGSGRVRIAISERNIDARLLESGLVRLGSLVRLRK